MYLGLHMRDHTETKTSIIKNLLVGKDSVAATLVCSIVMICHSVMIKGQYNSIYFIKRLEESCEEIIS